MLHKFNEVQPDTYIRRYTVGNAQVVFMLEVVTRGRMVVFKYYSPFDYKVMIDLEDLKMGRKRSLVFGVGVNDWIGDISVGGKDIREYQLWKSMLERCFSDGFKQSRPTYEGVTCSHEWLSMTNFIEDVSQMKGYGLSGWALDKDILVKGNKLYSKDTCCFVPAEVNSLLIKRDNCRGEYPVGVCFDKASGKFKASLAINGKRKHLGLFASPEEAFQVYKRAKEAQIKAVADKWQHLLDERVYLALMAYEVNIDD